MLSKMNESLHNKEINRPASTHSRFEIHVTEQSNPNTHHMEISLKPFLENINLKRYALYTFARLIWILDTRSVITLHPN
uniref:Uncharacterized protein n=1 Tax=Noccaea caerulescens TaxID=107243 RepID=A0A1J3HJX6_NOCCA